MATLVELIAKKRDGGELSRAEIQRLIDAHGDGQLADYQMSAFCMAVFFKGMTADETSAMTDAMLHSGRVIDLSHISASKVDKHSTGGVGDKVSLCLAPLVAACGVAVPMISGRGLGHTGGTLDKLEAIDGFNVSLDIAHFSRIVDEVGVCMIGQTGELAPADKRLYALRDVTATVETIPLIVASILSKKLAEGIDGLVLDVKTGRGAFMKDLPAARALARALVEVGTAAGKRVSALLTDMDAPLGLMVGNALETKEAIDILHGRGPDDTLACTLALGAEMLLVAGSATDLDDGAQQIRRAISTGAGLDVFAKMIAAQSGDPRVLDDPSRLPTAPLRSSIASPETGTVMAIDALEIGLSAVALGAGRVRADQDIDPAVGIQLCCARGAQISAGEPLAILHVREESQAARVAERVRAAFRIEAGGDTPLRPIVLERMGG